MTQATEKDIEKWCKFWNYEDYPKYDKLKSITEFVARKIGGKSYKSKYKYVNSNDDCYKYCELLTQEQIKVLGLEE